jgi:hypothetical protein
MRQKLEEKKLKEKEKENENIDEHGDCFYFSRFLPYLLSKY